MKKKLLITIIPIIIVVIAITIILLIRGTNDGASKLSKVYKKMITSESYAFTRFDFEEQHKIINYKKLNQTLIDMYNPGEHTSILIQNGNTYLIFHENKEYYIYANVTKDEEILINDIKEITELEYTTGKEKIYGKTYKYEEYNGASNFLISSSRYMDTNSVKTRFYFKGNELVYLKTMYDTVDEETGKRLQVEELQTVKVEYEVEDSIFSIPKEYAEG